MTKDAFYFSHDSNASNDPKIMMMMNDLGLEGYGFFWILVEILREQPGYRAPVSLVDVIAKRYDFTQAKAMTIVKNYGLFEVDEDEFFFSPSLSRRMNEMEKVREKKRLAGRKSAQKRLQQPANTAGLDSQQRSNGDATAFQHRSSSVKTPFEQSGNGDATKKQNKKKQNEKKQKENIKGCVFDLLEYYNFNEITNPDKLKQAHQFASILDHNERLDYFRRQFDAYREYKERTGEKTHTWPRFLGTIGENYEDGGWNARNWEEELSDQPQEGTTSEKLDQIFNQNS